MKEIANHQQNCLANKDAKSVASNLDVDWGLSQIFVSESQSEINQKCMCKRVPHSEYNPLLQQLNLCKKEHAR
jgi:hypothetical protein